MISSTRHRGFFLPTMADDDDVAKEERTKMRQEELENSIKTQHFYDWLATQKEKTPGSAQAIESLW